jgi:hypothetical protein
MPAPAPWANTKQARAVVGRIRSAETEAAFPIPMSSFCALAIFISSARYSRRGYSTLHPIRAFRNLRICTHHDASVRAEAVVIRIDKATRTRGGIVGMGEQVGDRLGMLMLLANLSVHPESVPIHAVRPPRHDIEIGRRLAARVQIGVQAGVQAAI